MYDMFWCTGDIADWLCININVKPGLSSHIILVSSLSVMYSWCGWTVLIWQTWGPFVNDRDEHPLWHTWWPFSCDTYEDHFGMTNMMTLLVWQTWEPFWYDICDNPFSITYIHNDHFGMTDIKTLLVWQV